MSDIQSFRDAVESFIVARGWTPTRFGRQMAGDPLFVFDLRERREPRSDTRTRMIPVVVLTTSREERDVIESYQLGVNSYIVKPVDFEQFNNAIKHLGFYWLLVNHAP